MTTYMPFGLADAILPMLALLAVVIGLPGLLVAKDTLSQRVLAGAMAKTAVVTWVVGAVLMAVLYGLINDGAAPARLGFYLGRSALLGLLWGPVLALVWMLRAQGVERRRGLLMRDVDVSK